MGHGADRGRLAEVGGASRLICNLFCPIGAVARIAKTRDNKRLFVLSTPERSCIGAPERICINDSGKKAPELGAFS